MRVFVSSTLVELASERAAVRAAIEGMHLIPVLFETGARPHPPRALYSAYIAQSDVFIGIYWQRYGWVAPGQSVSGLEDEYDLSARLPRLLYVKQPAPEREPDLARLLDRFQTEGGVSYRKFTDPDELQRLIADDLAVLLSERFATASPSGQPAPQRSTIPVPLTPTIGRAKEISALANLLRQGTRLVTVTGTGGVGKSRLAVAVALELADERDGDVHLVSLASVTDPRHLLATVAEHVGARLDSPTPLDDLAQHIGDRSAVLVLDNFEHLAAAGTDVVALLEQCPRLQVLVTSRHVLRVRGEHEFGLAPLAVPAPDATHVRKADAVRLFVDRAVAVRPDFDVTKRNEHVVAELCRRLDGLPLALELAAARLRLLEPEELLDRLGSRLDLLAGAAVDLPERQRALRATLDWSYNLLSPAEQTLFARLSVFAGGSTLAAAEPVCGDDELGDVVELMASLLEKSLLVHMTTAAGGPGRFQMLHVVRAYAWERLSEQGETDILRARHARWFLDATRALEKETTETRYEFFDAEVDNVRDVLAWTLDQADLAAAALLARGLRSWWWIRGMLPEALEWLERAVARSEHIDAAPVDQAWILLALGHCQQQVGLAEAAEAPLRHALDLFAAHGVDDGIVNTRLVLAAALADEGRMTDAIAMATDVLRRARDERRDSLVEWAASLLGTFHAAAGELATARAYEEEAARAAANISSDQYVAMAHHQLAMIELMDHRTDECWRHLGAAATIYRRTPHLDGVSYALEIAASACLAEHEVDRAVEAAAVAQDLHDRLRLPVWPVLKPVHDRLHAELSRLTPTDVRRSPPRTDPVALLQRLCDAHSAEVVVDSR